MPGTSNIGRLQGWSLFPTTPAKQPRPSCPDVNIQIFSKESPQHTQKASISTSLSGATYDSGISKQEREIFDSPAVPYREGPLNITGIPVHRRDLLEKSSKTRSTGSISPLAKEPPTNAQLRPRVSSQALRHKRSAPAMRSSSANGVRPPSSFSIRSREGSVSSYQSGTPLYALQQKPLDENDQLEPLNEEELDPGSFDLVAPPDSGTKQYSLETRSELLFSAEHLRTIFNDPALFLRFTGFLSSERASSVPILLYYLDAMKALKALSYANAVAHALDPIKGLDFSAQPAVPTVSTDLEEKARQAFDIMVRDDLPAYITHVYIRTVSLSIQRRITGTLPVHLRETSEGLAEVFCLTDPSRPDNPIVFASEEFHKTTQYGMNYVIGRNCRFLQGPKTNPHSVKRLRDTLAAGKEHCEVFLNYRRDGSPFMNLLMMAPLCDSRGTIRYFIGAQVDVSGLVKECADLESLQRLVLDNEDAEVESNDSKGSNGVNGQNSHKTESSNGEANEAADPIAAVNKQFLDLSEMLNMDELEIVRKRGGRMRQYTTEDDDDTSSRDQNWNKPRLLISSTSPDGEYQPGPISRASGKLSGIYENYLLIRPYPSLRVLFASPTLRVPGILQSPFMAKIGGSPRIRDELERAFADGRGVTAKVRWHASRSDAEGRNRWIHCTPLLGSNGAVGVWMVIIADDEEATTRKYRVAPPVDPKLGRGVPFARHSIDDNLSLRGFSKMNGGNTSTIAPTDRDDQSLRTVQSFDGTERSGSPYTLRV